MNFTGCFKNPTAKHAFYLSVIGCAVEGLFTAVGLAGYFVLGSPLLLVYGLENVVDFISSAVVLWRFYAPGELTKARELELASREERAGVAVSFLILLLGCLVVPAAVGDLEEGAPTDQEVDAALELVMIISFLSVTIFTSLTYLKLKYARILNSESLHKDGLCSVIGLLLSTLIFITSWLINKYPILWKIDAYGAMLCGSIAIFIGSHGIITAVMKKDLPIFSITFWKGETGTEPTNLAAGANEPKTQLSEVV
ncbi:unnamed protein product [Cylindrotheca closterium]|uniref:Cation efflux protein transmembrane domain-containing protein n=1 Tax=Cylindrotheca closterium TaxID=2856 RepID=A0AAD2FSZ5_9STRA|nr:unnamed protein product [Cylindrotheca closterium]